MTACDTKLIKPLGWSPLVCTYCHAVGDICHSRSWIAEEVSCPSGTTNAGVSAQAPGVRHHPTPSATAIVLKPKAGSSLLCLASKPREGNAEVNIREKHVLLDSFLKSETPPQGTSLLRGGQSHSHSLDPWLKFLEQQNITLENGNG